jgi:cyanate lyase
MKRLLSSGLRADKRSALSARLLAAKQQSGKTFDQIAKELQLTNVYTANLFYGQAQLKPGTAEKLKAFVPGIQEEDLVEMQAVPFRQFDPQILQEPNVYRTYEAVCHNGEAIKGLVAEKFGDGIMSAIDCFVEVKKVKGVLGEDRVVIQFNGKFLPHIEQQLKNNTAGLKEE